MEKYLGNKSSLLPLIDRFFQSSIPDATRLLDVFAGTNNVSRYFRGRGWMTAACDANRFSYVLAHAYLSNDKPPLFNLLRTRNIDSLQLGKMQDELARSMDRFGHLYLPKCTTEQVFNQLPYLANVLIQLQNLGNANTQPGVITDCFSQWGSRAAFSSRRGTQGTRNYFSRENALFLDGVLGAIRDWWSEGVLTRSEVFLLLTSILEEVVITANVSGTFHDFNRDRLWPNAEQRFQLRLPLVSFSQPVAELANADALAAAGAFASHDVCYIDPPYNFRQYNAYYHFLNFIAAYPFLKDVEMYVSGLSQVRGQHPEDDFTSDFCFRSRFISSLRRLIENVDSEHVVLSYYGGRNHWNHWSSVVEPTDEGFGEVRALFEDSSLFKRSEVVPVLEIRKNYQSRVGEQKRLVNEYLFHGVRRTRGARRVHQAIPPLGANVRWELVKEFRHMPATTEYGVDYAVRAVG